MMKIKRFPIAFADVTEDREMTTVPLRVFLKLCVQLELDTWRPLHQASIANKLDISTPAMSRAMRLLCEKGIVLRKKDADGMVVYRLNTTYHYENERNNVWKKL